MAKTKILMVEDEADIVRALKAFLVKEGYEFFHADTAQGCLDAVRRHKPDLILLDVVLPGMDGLALIQILRRETPVPIVFLSGKTEELDRVMGLKLGADDYVTKPFSIPELLARLQALLRRARGRRDGSPVKAGGLEIDLERHEVRVNGRHRDVAPREFQLLTLLVEADGKVVSRERVLEALWGADQSIEVSTRIVDQHVARLRRKLLGEAARIVTVKNAGYRLRLD